MPEFGNPRIPWIFSMRGIRCVDGFALGLFTSRSESGLASVKPPLVGVLRVARIPQTLPGLRIRTTVRVFLPEWTFSNCRTGLWFCKL